MNERLERAQQLGRRVDAGWQREDVEAQLARLHTRQRTRAARRALAAPLAAAAITAAVFAGISARREATPPAVPALRDVAVDRLAREVATAPVVTPAPLVTAGETRTFPVAAHDDVAPVDRDEPVAAPEPPSTWRDDGSRGDYAAAWDALSRAPAPVSMEDLLLAGDVARLSGHREAAVASLSRAVALHSEDPRAPLAAFTLGRVHLEDLGAPRDAALAFARARELAPGGPLAEDALAREVEAWSRAGEAETAHARALTYTRQYPQGRRVHAVRRFGGLESP